MIESINTKGLVMSVIFVILFLGLAYALIFRFTEMNPKPKSINLTDRIMRDLNDSLGGSKILSVTVEPVGSVFEEFNHIEHDTAGPRHLIVVYVKLERMDKCFSVLVENLSEANIVWATKFLIKKITTTSDDLKITC